MHKRKNLHSATMTATATGAAVDIDVGAKRLTTVARIASVSGTTPSFTVVVEGSYDGVSWFDLHTHDALTAAGSNAEHSSETQGTTVAAIPPLLRAEVTVSGTTPSAAVTVTALVER